MVMATDGGGHFRANQATASASPSISTATTTTVSSLRFEQDRGSRAGARATAAAPGAIALVVRESGDVHFGMYATAAAAAIVVATH